jgi:hypothetical protein
VWLSGLSGLSGLSEVSTHEREVAMKLARPRLREVPLEDVLPVRRGLAYVTLLADQWDGTLASAYSAGWVLLQLGDDEKPVKAHQRQDPAVN